LIEILLNDEERQEEMQTTTYRQIINLELYPNQRYVHEQAAKLDVEPLLLLHPRETDTCKQKVELLQERFPAEDWHVGRCVKTLFGTVDDDIVGFVMPETGLKLSQDLVQGIYKRLGLPSEEHYLSTSSMWIPEGMEYGTCTPFVPEDAMKSVDYIIMQDIPELTGKDVDISIGGKKDNDPEAHKKSMIIPYGAIFDILKAQFDGKIYRTKFK
jgi:hypothetical protein